MTMEMKTIKLVVSSFIVLLCFLQIIASSLTVAYRNESVPLVSFTNTSMMQNDTLVYSIISQINASSLEEYIRTIQGFGPHPTGSTALSRLRDYLYNELLRVGLEVHLLPWSYKLRQGDNIEATLEGSGSVQTMVLIGAHYDSISISPGADDDGSGVAGVLAIAHAMGQYQFNCTVKFVLYSGEEQGLLGSHEYAQEARKQNDNIIGVLNLDGVGYAASTEGGKKVWNFVDENAQWMVNIGRDLVETYPEFIDLTIYSRPNIPISDHQSFIDVGYVTNCYLEGTINPFYHTSEDIIDHVNLTYLTKVARLAGGTLATMAQLNRVLSNDDITIRMRGSFLSNSNFFSVQFENKKYLEDTANITIHVELKNRRTGRYLSTPYNATTNWTFSKEIGQSWEFVVGKQHYKTQLVRFTVTITGCNDDKGLYKTGTITGLVLPYRLLMIPHSF